MEESQSGYENSKEASPTVGIIVVGDEILKGHVQDTNSNFLCKQLWKLGVRVKKISVVSDDLKAIADEVRTFSKAYDFVITSGGIGPTHDDVTMEAIGLAFDEEMIKHPDMMKLLFKNTTPSPDNAWIKMATTPKSTTVINGILDHDSFVCPLMVVKNVYPFPGVPTGMRDTFIANKHLFLKSDIQFYLKEVFFKIDEDQLAKPLTMLQDEFKSMVDIGSYPSDGNKDFYAVKVTIEGCKQQIVEKCYYRLLLMIGFNTVHSVSSSYTESQEELSIRSSISWLCGYTCMDAATRAIIPLELCQKLKVTFDVIEESLKRYSFDEICVAFNGGKDCTVLIHLFHLYMAKKQREDKSLDSVLKIQSLYVAADQPFSEVEEFIADCKSRYNLELIKVDGSIQSALSRLKEARPSIKAVLMGTRYSDPYSDSLQIFSTTDPSWPQYMRVHPILEWSYHTVWLFLKIFRVDYCPLYDQGYTSLGNSINTLPNSSLLVDTPINDRPRTHNVYRPAYMLKDECLERAGRNQTIATKL